MQYIRRYPSVTLWLKNKVRHHAHIYTPILIFKCELTRRDIIPMWKEIKLR